MVDLGRWFTEAYRVPGEDAIRLDDPGRLGEAAEDPHEPDR
jgi:endogenous inhibitor of DNA gyrase (YacG/DUF329 family)